jgi:hypothetical protein
MDSWYGKKRQQYFGHAQMDYPLGKYVSLKMFERHLIAMTKYAKSDRVRVVLVSQPSLYKEAMSSEEQKVLLFGRSFCYSPHQEFSYFKEFPSYKSLYKAMRAFNQTTQKVALLENALFVDAANYIPKDLKHFVDDCHYTRNGAKLLAQVIAKSMIAARIVESD